ncbi:protein transport protein SEC23 D-like [Aristolochia californica]|uniref:protein transport protein SEC23 D-like n=1 Tax=Aristolochia californica TaxID=171875 RepID=UPI0035DCBD2B
MHRKPPAFLGESPFPHFLQLTSLVTPLFPGPTVTLFLAAIRATVSRFPTDPDAQEASGLPWGVTVSPFSPVDELGNPPVSGSNGNLVPRCDNCWAYFNSYCELEQWAWTCALPSFLLYF